MDDLDSRILRAIADINGLDSTPGTGDWQIAGRLDVDVLTVRDRLYVMADDGLVKIEGDKGSVEAWFLPRGRLALAKESRTAPGRPGAESLGDRLLAILELKPNLYGVGFNFNEILKRGRGKRGEEER